MKQALVLTVCLMLTACTANGYGSNQIYGEIKGGVESSKRF